MQTQSWSREFVYLFGIIFFETIDASSFKLLLMCYLFEVDQFFSLKLHVNILLTAVLHGECGSV